VLRAAVHSFSPGAVVSLEAHLLKAAVRSSLPAGPGAVAPLKKVHLLLMAALRVSPLLPSSTRAAALQQAPKVAATMWPAETMVLVAAFLIR